MNKLVAINKLSHQMGLTSRTLRHWEAEGLFTSTRDTESGWRIYDDHSVLCIHITAMLRKLGIPIKEIKIVLESKTTLQLYEAIENKIAVLKEQRVKNLIQEEQLKQALTFLKKQNTKWITELDKLWNETEDFVMSNMKINEEHTEIKIITLPPMRVAFNIAVGLSPEDDAMAPVIEWIESEKLSGTARLLGGNVEPMPTQDGKPYGYGMCATIPDGITVPGHLQEMVLPGGLYAMLESTDDIGGSWNVLADAVSRHNTYCSDRSRLCFEEHIRNDNFSGSGNCHYLHLLEPVKAK